MGRMHFRTIRISVSPVTKIVSGNAAAVAAAAAASASSTSTGAAGATGVVGAAGVAGATGVVGATGVAGTDVDIFGGIMFWVTFVAVTNIMFHF